MKCLEMSSVRHMYDKELYLDSHPAHQLTRDPDFSYNLACQLPHFLKERKIELGETDKLFAAEWISEDEVVVGTKCNKIFVVDVTNGSVAEIPTLRTINTQRSDDVCGIHSIAVSPEKQLVATGGSNPNELGVYKLPEWEPLTVGEGHADWLFDVRWISNNVVVSGSRDSTMAAWDVSVYRHESESQTTSLAEETRPIGPAFRFSNIQAQLHGTEGEKVRSLAFDPRGCMLGSLQTNPFSATVYFWDTYTFQQVGKTEMPYCVENVCMEADDTWNAHLYAVGSRSHVTLIDGRQPYRAAGSFKSLDRDCGVRSLKFNSHVLSIGTGAGHLYFYDLRAASYLDTEACSHGAAKVCSLKTSRGWLRHDAVYRDFFTGYPEPPNALYTHCYSPARSKIFVAGGPLPLGLYGNYAGVWQ